MSQSKSIVEASISDLSTALASGSLTSVELLAKYLLRISTYDCRNASLNSIPVLNENAFDEAAAADDRRAAGQSRGHLDGIPFTVKDSYKVKGMTIACGSEAFENLVANKDAFIVSSLRNAGAVLIGRTNMCPMAYGGMLRGVYGRAENPYNPNYLAAAFASGSSNGSGVSVASSLAAFGMGSETVSSGRSPASNNALIAYTPSKGLASVRGIWPLYPTCDVMVPHTRTMDDLLVLLDVIMAKDPETEGDFWRDQPFIPVPDPQLTAHQPLASIRDIDHLKGKRIAVPRMYITQCDKGPYVSESIHPLWRQAKTDLEAAGATIEVVEGFPVVQAYESQLIDQAISGPRLPKNWNATERGLLIAQGWEDFLQTNGSPNISSLTGVPFDKMFPQLPLSDPQVKFAEPANAVQWSKLASYAADRPPSSRQGKSPIYETPNLEMAVQALEDMRKHFFEDWLKTNNYDYVAFPAAGDAGRADADVNSSSAEHAWKNGVKYSHGNRALRHLGIPSVTVPMGMLEPHRVPMGLTVLGKAYDDVGILKAAYVYEQRSRKRNAPSSLPSLSSDAIPTTKGRSSGLRPKMVVGKCCVTAVSEDNVCVSIEGDLSMSVDADQELRALMPQVEIFVDGAMVGESDVNIVRHQQQHGAAPASHFSCEYLTPRPPKQDARNTVVGRIARDSTVIMVLARYGYLGRPSGYLKLIHASEI